ncbi:MAG: hypothetical protein RL885_08230 [Planctomycetota bacterium]
MTRQEDLEALRQSFRAGDIDAGLEALTGFIEAHGPLSDDAARDLSLELARQGLRRCIEDIARGDDLRDVGRRLGEVVALGLPLGEVLTPIQITAEEERATDLSWRRRASASLTDLALSSDGDSVYAIAETMQLLDPAGRTVWLLLAERAMRGGRGEDAVSFLRRFLESDEDPHRYITALQLCLAAHDLDTGREVLLDAENDDLPGPVAIELGILALLGELEERGMTLLREGLQTVSDHDLLEIVFSLTAIDLDLVDEVLIELPEERHATPHYCLCRAHRMIIRGDMPSAERWISQGEAALESAHAEEALRLRSLGALLRKGVEQGYDEEDMRRLVEFAGESLGQTHTWLDNLAAESEESRVTPEVR